MNYITLYQMPLDSSEMYDDWHNYLNGLGNTTSVVNAVFTFKAPTSMMSPSIIMTINYSTAQHYNYARMMIDDDQGSYIAKCYYIKDIITINATQCEIQLEFDAFRSVNWRNPNTKFKLAYSTDERKWAQTIVDPRFEPYASYAANGSTSWRYETKIPCAATGTAESTAGIYLVKWWWGTPDSEAGGSMGVVNGIMNIYSFQYFIAQVNNFIKDNWGSQLGGIQDFTKFIISAKFFPGLTINDCRQHAGYSSAISAVGVGGLCTVDASASGGYSNFRCYIKEDKAGFIDSYFFNEDEDAYFYAYPLGDDVTAHQANLRKMKWLTDSKWCQYLIRTPVGVGTIDMSTVRHGDKIFYNAQIDLETGIMTMNFMRNKTNASWTTYAKDADLLLSLQGPVYYDVLDKFTHIQSANEVVINSLTNSMVSGVHGTLATGNTAASISSFATAGTDAVKSLMSPRVINQPRASSGDNLYWFHRSNDSVKYFYVRTTVFQNPDTPIYDNVASESGTGWNAEVIYENYRDFCRQEGNGYPSIKVVNWSSDFLDAGTTWFQCSDVYEVRPASGDKIYITPEMEADIINKLRHGVTIHPGPI